MTTEPDTFSVHPIEVDFAGWSLVKQGKHNAWGVIHDQTRTLKAHYQLKHEAVAACKAVMARLSQNK